MARSKKVAIRRHRRAAIKKSGLRPWMWAVLQDLRHTMISKHRFTGEVKHINK